MSKTVTLKARCKHCVKTLATRDGAYAYYATCRHLHCWIGGYPRRRRQCRKCLNAFGRKA